MNGFLKITVLVAIFALSNFSFSENEFVSQVSSTGLTSIKELKSIFYRKNNDELKNKQVIEVIVRELEDMEDILNFLNDGAALNENMRKTLLSVASEYKESVNKAKKENIIYGLEVKKVDKLNEFLFVVVEDIVGGY